MAYSAWSVIAGEQPTAAKWNILGTNDSSFNDGTGVAALTIGATTAVKNSYKFSVYRNAGWTSSNSAGGIKVLFDTKTYDTGTNFDVVTNNRFVAPIAGFYFFSGQAGNSTAGGGGAVNLRINGTLTKWGTDSTGDAVIGKMTGVSGLLQLAATDYVELYYQGGAGSTGLTGATFTYLDGFLVSAT